MFGEILRSVAMAKTNDFVLTQTHWLYLVYFKANLNDNLIHIDTYQHFHCNY